MGTLAQLVVRPVDDRVGDLDGNERDLDAPVLEAPAGLLDHPTARLELELSLLGREDDGLGELKELLLPVGVDLRYLDATKALSFDIQACAAHAGSPCEVWGPRLFCRCCSGCVVGDRTVYDLLGNLLVLDLLLSPPLVMRVANRWSTRTVDHLCIRTSWPFLKDSGVRSRTRVP